MSKILISYRRSDSAAITGRIYDRLIGHYGRETVFMDIDSVPFGTDFRRHIEDKLIRSDVVIAVVGTHWLGANADGSRRIDQSDDPVRVEIETALRSNARLVPVLVDGALMPPAHGLPESLQPFAFLNAATVESGRDFNHQMDRLIGSLDALQGIEGRSGPAVGTTRETTAPSIHRSPAWIAAAIGGAAVAGLVVAIGLQKQTLPENPVPAKSPQESSQSSSQASLQKRDDAKKGIDEVLFRLRNLVISQRINLLPSIESYLQNPSPARWMAIRQEVAETTNLIRNAMRAVLEYDARLANGLGPQLQSISGVLRSRSVMVNEISLSEKPMSPEDLRKWQSEYRKLISQLSTELTTLRARID